MVPAWQRFFYQGTGLPKALALTVLLLCGMAAAAKPAVTDLGRIDRVVVEKSTGQATLFLVIDLPLEDGLTKRRVIRKLNLYAAVVKSGELRKQFRRLTPHGRFGCLSTIHPRPMHWVPVCSSRSKAIAASSNSKRCFGSSLFRMRRQSKNRMDEIYLNPAI